MDQATNEIMTIEEVAAFLRIPSSSVYKLAQEGKIPSLKVGRHWRFHRTTLNQWVIEQASLAKNRPEHSPE